MLVAYPVEGLPPARHGRAERLHPIPIVIAEPLQPQPQDLQPGGVPVGALDQVEKLVGELQRLVGKVDHGPEPQERASQRGAERTPL